MSSPDWVPVGRLFRSRGRIGELFAEMYSSRPGRAEALKIVRLVRGERSRDTAIERAWYHEGRLILKFSGIDSISDAEPWEGADLLAPAEQRSVPAEGEFSHQQLIGCEVLAAGERLGVVQAIEEFGGPPLLKVEKDDGGELLIPFARAICREIDVARKTIQVEMPEGLAEL